MNKNNKIIQNVKSGVLFAGLGLLLAQGLVMITIPAKAEDSENGSCAPKTSWVCGLNGQNYDDKVYVTTVQGFLVVCSAFLWYC